MRKDAAHCAWSAFKVCFGSSGLATALGSSAREVSENLVLLLIVTSAGPCCAVAAVLVPDTMHEYSAASSCHKINKVRVLCSAAAAPTPMPRLPEPRASPQTAKPARRNSTYSGMPWHRGIMLFIAGSILGAMCMVCVRKLLWLRQG